MSPGSGSADGVLPDLSGLRLGSADDAVSPHVGLRFGYGTNGFANHRLDDALAVIADLGYDGVALTLDHHHLDPFAPDLAAQVDRVRGRLGALGLDVVVETGARYLLDPRTKHHPTLVSADVARRVDFLRRAVRIAADLGARCVSFWSGVLPAGADPAAAWVQLRAAVAEVLPDAEDRGVVLGLEPEPGHLVQRLADALALRRDLGSPAALGVTLDVGHCVAVEPVDAAACIREAAELLVNVQLDDMLPGVHEHLEFGEGELDLGATLAALTDVGYPGLAAVELPRHSHAAPDVAARSRTALQRAVRMFAAPGRVSAAGGRVLADSDGVLAVSGGMLADPAGLDDPGRAWLDRGAAAVRDEPAAIRTLFPAAGREVGRAPTHPETDPQGLVHGTVDDAARVRLLGALDPDALAAEVPDLYRYGDDAEKRGVLRGLAPTGVPAGIGVPLVQDALRANDIRLVAAAMGPYATNLDDHSWRHGVLKCLFVGVPLDAVAGWRHRADPELRRMVADYAAERTAAGREVPADARRLLADPQEGA